MTYIHANAIKEFFKTYIPEMFFFINEKRSQNNNANVQTERAANIWNYILYMQVGRCVKKISRGAFITFIIQSYNNGSINNIDNSALISSQNSYTNGKAVSLMSKLRLLQNPINFPLVYDSNTKNALSAANNHIDQYSQLLERYQRINEQGILFNDDNFNESLSIVNNWATDIENLTFGNALLTGWNIEDILSIRRNRFIDKLLFSFGNAGVRVEDYLNNPNNFID